MGEGHNYSAQIYGRAPFSTVRLGYDGTHTVILLGMVTTVVHYLSVDVAELISERGSQMPTTGWAMTQVTDESPYSGIVTPPITSWQEAGASGNDIGYLAGNVGIGTTTPGSALEVSGTLPTGSSNTSLSKITGTMSETGSYGQNALYITTAFSPASAATGTLSGIKSAPQTSSANTSGANITGVYGVPGVTGSANLTGLIAIEAQPWITTSGTVTTTYGVKVDTPTNSGGGTITNTYGLYINSQAAGTQTNTPFGIYQAGTADRNYFGGNVGIGTTSPASRLHVGVAPTATANYGLVSLGAGAFDGSTAGYFGTSSSSNSNGTVIAINTVSGYTGDLVNYEVAGSSKFKVDYQGNVNGTAFLYTSDRRLKTNIETLPNGLDTILKMRGVHFNWIANGEPEVGLIAQEVEKVLPDLVKTNPSSGLKSVKYGNIVAPLIEAVKSLYSLFESKTSDQQMQIDQLKQENAALKERLDRLEKSVAK